MLKLVYLLLIFPTCIFVPGYLFARRNKLSEEFKLVQSISLSVMFIYVVSFVFYLLKFNWLPYVIVSTLLLIAGIALRRDIFAFISTPTIKNVLIHYTIFFVWIMILLMFIRNYSGGDWSGDWEEHYQRSLFFKEHYPYDVKFINQWLLPARPPLYNLVASFFMNHLGNNFFYYQATSVMLNTLVYFGAYAVLYALNTVNNKSHAKNLFIMTLLLCFNPSVVENVTYTWTRSLSNFFILYSLALYGTSVFENNFNLRRISYLTMGLAVLTHYSAFPYLVGIVLLDLYFICTRRNTLKEYLINAGVFLATFSSWLIFSIYRYGLKNSFGSNSTVIDSTQLGLGQNIVKICNNLWNTLIPHVFRDISYFQDYTYNSDSILEYLRDYAFLIYQVNFFFLFGSLGWLVVLFCLKKRTAVMIKEGKTENWVLLWFFLLLIIVLGVAVHGGKSQYGLAHICLQPIAILGLSYLAASYINISGYVRCLLCISVSIDLVFGIFLHFWIQHNITEYNVKFGYEFLAETKYSAYIIALLILCLLISLRYAVKNINNSEVSCN